MRRIFVKGASITVLLGLSGFAGYRMLRSPAPSLPRNASPDDRELARADALAKLGNWDAARPIFARLEKRFGAFGDSRNELYAHVSRLRAEEEFSDLQKLSGELRDILLRAEVQRDLALKERVLETKGNVDLNLDGVSARPAFEELERVATQRNNVDAASRARGELGVVAFLEGNASEAKSLVFSAVANALIHQDIGAQIRYWSMIGQALVETHRASQALWFLDHAINLAERSSGAGFPKIAMVGKAAALTQLGRFGEATQIVDHGLRYGRRNGYLGYEVDMLTQQGQLAAQQNDLSRAIASLEEASDLAGKIHFNRGLAEVNAQLAALYRRAGDLPKAVLAARSSVNAHRHLGEVYELPHHLAIEANLDAATGNSVLAQQTFETAERIVTTMLQNTPTVAIKKAVVAGMSEVFTDHFVLEVNMNDVSRAYDVIEEARGRVAADRLRVPETKFRSKPQIAADERQLGLLQMKLLDAENPADRQTISDEVTEAEDRLSPHVGESLLPPVGDRPSLRDLQRVLRPSETVLEYVTADEASYCLAVWREGANITRLPDRKTIDALTDRYLAALKQKRPAKEEGSTLYSAVLRPIAEIADRSDLIIVPDGSLHRIPFCSLFETGRGQYLLENRVVSYAPSGSVLTLLRRRSVSGRKDVLAVGGVPYGRESAQARAHASRWALFRGLESLRRDEMKALPATMEEVRELRDVLSDKRSVVLSGNQATETNFKREASKDFAVVHLAVHAFADTTYPDRAGLVFAADPDAGDDGLLQVREIRELTMSQTNLVTLSACDTSVGRIDGEEGVSSIVYAFLYAGARSAVASYWILDDSSTTELMKTFYAELARGATEASAMRTAQLTLLRRGGETEAPFYWAAFNVMGDGSTRPAGDQ